MSAHEAAIIFSRTAAGELRTTMELAQPFPLEPSVFPGITGHATGLMGIHSAEFDDPTNDFFQLSPDADFRLILLAKTPGMEVWNYGSTAFMQTNESFFVGVPPFDTHPIWNLVTNSPDGTNALTLKLHDVNGIYADSDPFTITFTELVPPTLEIKQENSQLVTLSWPLEFDDWTLESATAVKPTGWATVTNLPVDTGTNFSLTLGATNAQRFFRLRWP